MKKMSKWDIACAIESLPGNVAWTAASMATLQVDYLTRGEFVDWYNNLISLRGLHLKMID